MLELIPPLEGKGCWTFEMLAVFESSFGQYRLKYAPDPPVSLPEREN